VWTSVIIKRREAEASIMQKGIDIEVHASIMV
jgi:hypothetical protein